MPIPLPLISSAHRPPHRVHYTTWDESDTTPAAGGKCPKSAQRRGGLKRSGGMWYMEPEGRERRATYCREVSKC